MKKCILLLLCLVLLCMTVFAEPTDVAAAGAVIRNLDAEYRFASDGTCSVVLTAQMAFSSGTTEFALPVPERAQELTVSASGYRTVRENGALFVVLSANGQQLPDQTVVLGYTLPETTAETADGQRCTLPLLLSARACAITHFSATISFPKEFEALPLFESGYYGDLIDNYLDISIESGVVTLSSTQSLRDHESLSMTLDLPMNYFDLRFLAGKTAGLGAVLFWLCVLAAAVYWFLFLRNPFFVPKAQAMPPLTANAGAIPYVLTGETPDLALMVMHWASLGYLSLARTRKGKLYLMRQIDMGSERKPYEVQLFRSLFSRTDLCAATSETYAILREKAPAMARGHWKNRLFHRKSGRVGVLYLLGAIAGLVLSLRAFDALVVAQSWRWFLILPLAGLGALACRLMQGAVTAVFRRHYVRTLTLGALGLLYLMISCHLAGLGLQAFLCVLVQLLIGFGAALGGRRTHLGLRNASELFGLQRYLYEVPAGDLDAVHTADPQYFYRTLPYAEALGVGPRFVRKFLGLRMEPCAWLTSESSKPKTAAGFYRLFSQALGELRGETVSPLRRRLDGLRRRSARRVPKKGGA